MEEGKANEYEGHLIVQSNTRSAVIAMFALRVKGK